MDPVLNYEEALKPRNSRKVVTALASLGGVANFSDISKQSGVLGSTLIYHLNRLQSLGVVKKETKGTYRLRYATPLAFIFNQPKIESVYLGLLGRRKESEPEPMVAMRLLKEEGFDIKLAYVLTSVDALNEWKDLKLQYNWVLCYKDEIIDIDAVETKIEPVLESLLERYIVIMDSTGATKPATIAYYELAQKYLTPLVYIHEETLKLKWLISKDIIKRKIGISKP